MRHDAFPPRYPRPAAVEARPDTPHPVAIPEWAEVLVSTLDDGFRVPGTSLRFGLDGIIGLLLPGVGDVLTGVSSLMIVNLALQRGVPRVVPLRMLLNLLCDAAVGAIPLVGDAFDFAFKSNRRNLRLLQRAAQGQRSTRFGDYLLVGLVGLLVLGLLSLPWLLIFWLSRS